MPTVLLVDDEERFRTSLAQRLRLRGYETIDLGSGEEAVKRARADASIDVVVLDRKMPGMSGEEVLKEIKQFRPEVQIIMLTGHGSIESATEAGRLDAYAYLEKPCDLEQLVAAIEDGPHRHSPGQAPVRDPPRRETFAQGWLVGSTQLAAGDHPARRGAVRRAGLHSALGAAPRAAHRAQDRRGRATSTSATPATPR